KGEPGTKRLEGNFAQILSVDSNAALLWVKEALNQAKDRGLACARGADQCGDASRSGFQAYPFQGRGLAIGENNLLELDAAALADLELLGVGCFCDSRFGIEKTV